MPAGQVVVVLGTRPEFVKLAPIVEQLGSAARVIHTGQHFHPSMSRGLADDFGMVLADAEVCVGGLSRGAQLGGVVAAIDEALRSDRPSAVIVHGDTTSALGGALAANANDIPLVHVEAGLRSFDRRMPEEHNRKLVDHLADLCCAPNQLNRQNLLNEGVAAERIVVTGNSVVEAVRAHVPNAAEEQALLAGLDLRPGEFVLVTLHRPENVDDEANLRMILTQLGALPAPVVLPLHPRTERRIAEFGLEPMLKTLVTLPPLQYPPFLALADTAAIIVTDSGGVQEEATVLKRPVIVVRRSNERPEIEGSFGIRLEPSPGLADVLATWLAEARERQARVQTLDCPYGDGLASTRVATAVGRLLTGDV